jgi:hypothetical protein
MILCVGGIPNGKEEVSLRPQKHFILKPNTPAMLPRSTQAAPSAPIVPSPGSLSLTPMNRMKVDVANPPIMNVLKQPQITIKPAKEDKPKTPKVVNTISEQELKEKVVRYYFHSFSDTCSFVISCLCILFPS